MVDFKKMADKAKDTFDKNRDKAEDLAEKGMDAYERRTGKKVPDAVRRKVDEIDRSDDVEPTLPDTPPPAKPTSPEH